MNNDRDLSKKDEADIYLALAQAALAHGCRLGPAVRRVEQVQVRALEVGRGQPVGDQDDLPVGRVLGGEELAGDWRSGRISRQ